MILHCPGKRCNTTREHKLKIDTNEVMCLECLTTNASVSEFMKSAMKASNDFYRAVEARQAFMYKCARCELDRAPKIVNEQAVCSVCLHPFKLSAPMIEAIKTTMTKSVDAEEKIEPKAELNKGAVKRRKA